MHILKAFALISLASLSSSTHSMQRMVTNIHRLAHHFHNQSLKKQPTLLHKKPFPVFMHKRYVSNEVVLLSAIACPAIYHAMLRYKLFTDTIEKQKKQDECERIEASLGNIVRAADKAAYMLKEAESFFKNENYDLALIYFKKVAQQSDNLAVHPHTYLRLGQIYSFYVYANEKLAKRYLLTAAAQTYDMQVRGEAIELLEKYCMSK